MTRKEYFIASVYVTTRLTAGEISFLPSLDAKKRFFNICGWLGCYIPTPSQRRAIRRHGANWMVTLHAGKSHGERGCA